ncbi:MAG: PSD1 and planctomycete cytochrome C domain-containing protein [Planctomycetota bacterium]
MNRRTQASTLARTFAFGGCAALALAVASPGSRATPGDPAPEPVRYDRDVRPLLSDRCFRCHGPDPGERKSGLRLDSAEEATADLGGGYGAIVPGAPGESELFRRITSQDDDLRMPPRKSGRRSLSPEETELLRRWISEGARYEPHWSFVPPARPELPDVRDAAWPANPIDRFVLAKLERQGVAPSPAAEAETLCRRLFLDLTGLPPTIEEQDAFLAESRSDPEGSWRRWVERLLTEEPYVSRYAERMATPWLDAARYADTCGIHMDAGRQIWLWRDWVLGAFRDGMPFDRFLTEQLAGDLLPGATQAQKIASGFNRNHVTTDEGGAIPEEYLVEYAVDRAATTSTVFLGLTMGCARCHEHKFDPISQEEFYSFYAFFDSIEEPGLYSQLPDPNRAFEPFLRVPRPEQEEELADIARRLAAEKGALEAPVPDEDQQRERFLADLSRRAGISWKEATTVSAASTGGSTLSIEADGAVLASGANPEKDDHEILLRTPASGLRLLLLEARTDPSFGDRVGRAPNGNAVLTGVTAEAVSIADPSQRAPVRFHWAWADHEQADGDFQVVNVLEAGDERGWAVDAHRISGGRVALLLAEEPFGFEGGTELRIGLEYRSIYAQHVLGRLRFSLGEIDVEGLALLPTASGAWHFVGPFPADSRSGAYATAFGPEEGAALDFARNFGFGNQFWRHDATLEDGKLNNALPQGLVATYVGKRLHAPTARRLEVSLGSDDGFRLYQDGVEVAGKEVDRALAADQDKASLELRAGPSTVVLKVVNTGGEAGFYWKGLDREGEIPADLVAALLPARARTGDLDAKIVRAWRTRFSPAYRERAERIAALERRAGEIEALVPLTMVMQELPKARETFVLVRGQYDQPDKNRPVSRGVPAALGRLAEDLPRDRQGLAQWMTSPENPLVARVAVNRLWEQVFGTGIVRTSEDFGMQGEWPSHPELLDWLAVEFRESGWDLKSMLRLMVGSRTYRQSSRARPDVRERDADDRWISWFPRARLSAEQIRDAALHAAGLLTESFGGPSVKPYQPEGLWQEVAMVQSNTREYARGEGADLWRRSLYTYWKRACPPPALQTLDAPTRESCVVRRATTNTPLQALALWNDEQFVEAARALAERALVEPGSEEERLARTFRRCTGRAPDADELGRLVRALHGFLERYRASPGDAAELARIGAAPLAQGVDVAELAAWTLVANAILNLDATITRS